MHHVTLAKLTAPAALGERWRALEASAQGGFFRSWTFLHCQFESRFTDPYLLAVTENGQDLALAVLNRRRERFHLGETGNAAQDAVFAEHGGILVRTGAEAVLPDAYRAITAASAVTLAGVDDTQLEACRVAGLVHIQQQRFAPALDLTALTGLHLATLSANARAQIRRARRLCGPDLTLSRAETLAQAQQFFKVMVALHQASWQRRGAPGAFATDTMRRFHETLIGRAWPRDEADLLRVSAGGRDIGVLYNFLHGGRVFCYQSGFAPPATPQEKPGLVCHSLAIEHYAARQFGIYDMLAGASRYKKTLVPGGQNLHWLTLYPRGSWLGRARVIAAALRPGRVQHWRHSAARPDPPDPQ